MQDKLNMLVEFITKNDINVKGIIINKDSQSYKHYFSNERVNVYSIAKSITALCIFNLENLNLISFDDKMVSFFPEMKYSKGTENITIQNLLDMRSGKDTSFIGDIPTDDED